MAANKPVWTEDEKVDPNKADEAGVPTYTSGDEDLDPKSNNNEYYKLGFWTRMGCTPESFKRRTAADKSNQLNQTLRSRHMHMIAIGKLIRLSAHLIPGFP